MRAVFSWTKVLCYVFAVLCLIWLSHIYVLASEGWFVFSILSLSLIRSGNVFLHRALFIVLTGALAAGLVLLLGLISTRPIGTVIALFVVVSSMAFCAEWCRRWAFSAFIIGLFVAFSASFPVVMIETQHRTLAILFGMASVLLLQWLFSYRYATERYAMFALQALHQLQALNSTIFACFLQPEYPKEPYRFEKKLHDDKSQFLSTMYKLREQRPFLSKKNGAQHWAKMAVGFEGLFSAMLACAQLRRRACDHTIFQLCHEEMRALCGEINQLLVTMTAFFKGKRPFLDLGGLDQSILELENTYQGAIQVAAREPMAFFLFLCNVRALKEEVLKLLPLDACH